MPRIRTIKPAAFGSESLSAVSVEARWTFAGLWTYVDDAGRGKANPSLIKAHVFPLDDDKTAADVDRFLAELEPDHLVRYAVDGTGYLQIVNWHHQKISHPSPSTIPSPPEDSGKTPERSRKAPDLGRVHSGGLRPDREVDKDRDKELSDLADARPDVERICKHLADRIEANGSKRPDITKRWLAASRLMLDQDERTEDQVHKAIDWCQSDGFWRANVLSMPKLREKYDQLRPAAQGKTPTAGPDVNAKARIQSRQANPLASAL